MVSSELFWRLMYMKLKDLSKEELEAMSYDDIALMILTESGKQYKINELFKKFVIYLD